jgi:hypothetical protein
MEKLLTRRASSDQFFEAQATQRRAWFERTVLILDGSYKRRKSAANHDDRFVSLQKVPANRQAVITHSPSSL